MRAARSPGANDSAQPPKKIAVLQLSYYLRGASDQSRREGGGKFVRNLRLRPWTTTAGLPPGHRTMRPRSSRISFGGKLEIGYEGRLSRTGHGDKDRHPRRPSQTTTVGDQISRRVTAFGTGYVRVVAIRRSQRIFSDWQQHVSSGGPVEGAGRNSSGRFGSVSTPGPDDARMTVDLQRGGHIWRPARGQSHSTGQSAEYDSFD